MAEARLTEVEAATVMALGIAADVIGTWLNPRPWQWKGASGILLWLGPKQARFPRDLDIEVEATLGQFEGLLRRPPNEQVGRSVRFIRSEPVIFTPGGRRPVVFRVVYEAIAEQSVVHRSMVEFILSDELRGRSQIAVPWLSSIHYQDRFPSASIERLLAEKLRRYTVKRRGGRINTRWHDLLDMLLVARFSPRPIHLKQLRTSVIEDFGEFNRPMVVHLPVAPAEWLDHWDAARLEGNYEFGPLRDAEVRLRAFWEPILNISQPPADRLWIADEWQWG